MTEAHGRGRGDGRYGERASHDHRDQRCGATGSHGVSRLLGFIPRATDRPRVTLRPGAVTDGGKAAWRRRVRHTTVPRTTGDDVMPLLKSHQTWCSPRSSPLRRSRTSRASRRRPESLYGSLKMWPHLQRQGITVARCTGGADHVEQTVGSGVTRAEQVRTTISDPAADRAPDLVNRQLRVWGPNELFFADVTYVPMGHRGCSPAPRS